MPSLEMTIAVYKTDPEWGKPTVKPDELESISSNVDDFDNTVYPSDIVMKIAYTEKKMSIDRILVIPHIKYVCIDDYVEILDDIGIDNQTYSLAMEGKDYLQKKQKGELDRE